MLTESPAYIFLNGVFTKVGQGLKKVLYEISQQQDGFVVNFSFNESCEINNIGFAFDLQDTEIVYMSRLQNGNKGLVCNNSNTQIVLLKSGGTYIILKISGTMILNETFLRFATQMRENLLCIGFYHSFWINKEQNDFCFQNLLSMSKLIKGTAIKIEVKIKKGSSIFECVEKLDLKIKSFEVGFNPDLSNKRCITTMDITRYSKLDVARKYNMSLVIPARVLKFCFLYLPKRLSNYELSYTSSLQSSCLYYLKTLNSLNKNELLNLQEKVEQLCSSERVYFNFYNKNIMLTSIKTYYQLPYVLLLYAKLCFLTGREITASIGRLIEEVEWFMIRNGKFFSDNTLANLKDYDKIFENKIYPTEVLTLYICYELYKLFFNYYEDLTYFRFMNNLRALMFLHCDFDNNCFYKNNYSFKKEELLKIIEREDRK